jgi:hypothetical protein
MRVVLAVFVLAGLGCAAEVVDPTEQGERQHLEQACELGSFTFESRRADAPSSTPTPGALELLDAGDGLVTMRLPGVGRECTAPITACTVSVDCMTNAEVRMLAELTIDGDVLEGMVTVEHAGGSIQLELAGNRAR